MSSAAEPSSQQEFLGAQLRALRGARRLSLGDVARETGISASFLSLVETGRSDITMGRLTRLVDYYGISITDLLPQAEDTDPDVVRAGETRTLHSPQEGTTMYLLTSGPERSMLPMLLELDPGSSLAERGRHAGEEFVHVLAGTLRLELDGSEPFELSAGDSAYYRSDRPHLFRNASTTQPLRLICVDSPPPL
jgi:transcriptional regulator with XRE-family HTH domain